MNKHWYMRILGAGLYVSEELDSSFEAPDLESATDAAIAILDGYIDKLNKKYGRWFAYEILESVTEPTMAVLIYSAEDSCSELDNIIGHGFIERDK